MNKKGRIENSIKNSVFGVAGQIANTLMGLIVRTVFIYCLNAEYLGINGLFTNILTMLSLAELGVGNAIIYNMYKPIANNDEASVAKLMNLYSIAYKIIGCVVAVIGFGILPFLKCIIKELPGINGIEIIYLMYLANTVSTYFFAYKRSIFLADQRERIITIFDFVFQAIKYAAQILVLFATHNYIAYLLIQIVCTSVENIFISIYADKQYDFLKKFKHLKLTKEEEKPIFENIKALFLYKVGGIALDGTDNIIISAFDGVISVGLLSNYTLITGSVQMILNKITSSLSGSLGNFIAKEKAEQYNSMLNNLTFIHFLLYGQVLVGSMAVINPFIALWAGRDYVMSTTVVFTHCVNIYIFGMMSAVWMFRTTMGLFTYGKWRPLFSAVINIVVSTVFARHIGLLGVLLGTTFTRVSTNLWYDSYIVYHYGLKKSPINYYFKWILYFIVVLLDIAAISLLKAKLVLEGIPAVIVYGIISVIVFALSVVLVYGKTEEFKYLKNVMAATIKRILRKKK